eukprot:TRINITY_DN11972_c0_g1_i1.p1 TRINITY_DN11972_c0_g1~~TRINITY_DN11972_c0_g1_i1.p1  ORF type:complete len:320 (+),score=67.29 TRINITY_DN11972_c0_g1_i1:71-1030(+)
MTTESKYTETKSFEIIQSCVKIIECKPDNDIRCCKFSNDGQHLVIVFQTGAICIFDVITETCQYLGKHESFYNDICFSFDGSLLSICSNNGLIEIYRWKDLKLIKSFPNSAEITSIVFSTCSRFLYVVDENGYLNRWNLESDCVDLRKKVHMEWIHSLVLSNDGKFILTCSDDCLANLINSEDFSIVRSFGDGYCLKSIAFHPTKNVILASDDTSTIKVWDVENGDLVHTFTFNNPVSTFQFCCSDVLISMVGDGYFNIFNTYNYDEIQRFYCGCSDEFSYFCISPDNKFLACGICNEKQILIYRIAYDLSTSHKTDHL